ncbi:unnamed protein product, partial [Didymodactylos carnosus]
MNSPVPSPPAKAETLGEERRNIFGRWSFDEKLEKAFNLGSWVGQAPSTTQLSGK